MRRHGRKGWFAVFMTTALVLGTAATIAPAGAPVFHGRPVAPGKPSAKAMNFRAKVKWTAPLSQGGPIDQYTVVASIGNVPKVTKVFKSKAVSEVVTGLKNGTAYTFKVRAHNKVGWGPYSPQSNAVRVGAPAAPAKPKVTRGNESVSVQWAAPAANGASIAGYVVTPFDGATALAPRVFDDTALAQQITGLTDDVVYRFKVAATNSRGTGAGSPLSPTGTPTATPALRLVNNPSIGQPILVDSAGKTVYLYTVDGSNTTSAVNGSLRTAWPYVVWGGPPSVGAGLDASKAVVHQQPDGSYLLSYNGHLLYGWFQDAIPGDATGQGINNFFVLDGSGNKIP